VHSYIVAKLNESSGRDGGRFAPYLTSLAEENTCGAFFCFAALHRTPFLLRKRVQISLFNAKHGDSQSLGGGDAF
jgi:hypothetical protein